MNKIVGRGRVRNGPILELSLSLPPCFSILFSPRGGNTCPHPCMKFQFLFSVSACLLKHPNFLSSFISHFSLRVANTNGWVGMVRSGDGEWIWGDDTPLNRSIRLPTTAPYQRTSRTILFNSGLAVVNETTKVPFICKSTSGKMGH